jgi:hypothetical protein
MNMNMKKKFIFLFIIFGMLNLIDFTATAMAVFLPGFEEINPAISALIVNSLGMIIGLKVCILFLFGIAGRMVFMTESEWRIRLFLQELEVLDGVLAAVCGFNIGHLIYYVL